MRNEARDMPTADLKGMRDWARGMWAPVERVCHMPRQSEDDAVLMQRLAAESDLIDMFRRYHYMYDAGNVDAIMDMYTEDAIVMNPRGTYIGRDAVRENFEFLVAERRFIMHYGTNPLIRFERAFDVAWFTAFFWCIELPKEKAPTGVGGTYVNRLRKEDDRSWRMFEQRITINFGFDMAPVASALGHAPPPTDAMTSHDLIEPATVL